ncbi:gliding motility-associated C-terminal domain-containing protein [Hymenobacter sp. M29]|uniref:Gliding motility-associated C-terminal domain-containing protein n=1 Tax=Hymenobacter mellowenesis TaxID=3063995 RepID=A0ABT9AGJ2_9BACT|nr:gliding motility-associated C-terminal domain-containing protein [Hymenobacter sp. M29]MDO7848984.1 gliding motility-associated C-terminal domain-containing protein [Hymenobacter sp. M29]
MRLLFTLLILWGALLSLPVRGQQARPTLEFIENRGQWDARARYAAQVAPSARLFVEATGLTYALTTGLPGHGPQAESKPAILPGGQVKAHGLRLEFIAPSPTATLEPAAEAAAPGRRHYLRGADARRWARDVRAWYGLRYRQLWPGIDLVLKENTAQQFEYDLLLAPGADPAQARWNYRGADALRLDPATGRLEVRTTAGLLTELAPRAWQTDPTTGQPQAVACAFELQGTAVSFRLGAYDRQRPLVIDPAVQFASYTGSSVENWGFAATHDARGNLYTAGVVFEPGYPTTSGAYLTAFSGSIDITIMKFNASATGTTARAWATYLGGNNLEFPHSLLVNARNELLLLGTTSSTDYPTTTTALNRSLRGGPAVAPFGLNSPFVLTGGSDLVLTRLSASGGGLRASTYLGGTGTDGLLDPAAAAPRLRHNYGDAFRGDLALDPQGNVYVASVTGSANFPGLVAGAYRGGSSDGLVTSLDSTLNRVRWTTLVGGAGADAIYSLQREDVGGDLLVAGGTTSATLNGSASGYQVGLAGNVDGFVARLTGAGALTQSTYLGTSGYDQAFFVRSGPGGRVYVLGQTLGPTWPGLDTTRYHVAHGQQFIQQLQPNLRTAGFATVFGSGRTTTDISPTAFGVDCYGRMALAGWGGGLDPNNGSTTGLPTTPDALQRATDGVDFYLMQLSDGARGLDYATFFGTTADDHVDGGMSRFDGQNVLYQAVCACDQGGGTGIPVPPGAGTYTSTNGSPHCNNAAFKFAFQANTSPAGTDTLSVCARGNPVLLSGSPEGGTWTGPGVSGSLSTGFFFVPSAAPVGQQVLTYTSPAAVSGCAGTSTRRITVLPQATATLTAPRQVFCLLPGTTVAPVQLTGTPAGGTFTGRGVVPGTSLFDPMLAGRGNHSIVYQVTGGRCPVVATLVMVVKVQPVITPHPPLMMCANDPPIQLVGTPPGGIWTGPGVLGSIDHFSFSPTVAMVGGPHLLVYSLQGDADCTPVTDTMRILVLPAGGTARVPRDTAYCLSGGPMRLWGGTPAGGTWAGPGVTGSLATGYTFTPTPQLVGGQYLFYTGPPGNTPLCPGRARRLVFVRSAGLATLSVTDSIVCAAAGPQALSATPPGGRWTGPGVAGSVSAGFTFTPSAALAGVQTLSYTGPTPADTSCAYAGQLKVRVLPLPLVLFAPVGAVSICLAAPPHGVVLSASPAGGTFGGPGVVGNRFNPGDVGPGRYTLTYTWDFPELRCPIVVSQTVVVSVVPNVQVPTDTTLCNSQGPFQLRASPAGGTWRGPGVTANGMFTPPTTPGTVALYYELPGGCATAPYRITIPAAPGFTATWTALDCADNPVAPLRLRFAASGATASQVEWDFGDGSPAATGATVEHTYADGRFVPRAMLPNGSGPPGPCQRQVTLAPVEVQAALLPNIITPNNDGQNDFFAPRLGGCPGRLQVFSRWGQRVFDVPEYHNDWDGAGLPAGLYYYLFSRADGGERVKGWVEIVR